MTSRIPLLVLFWFALTVCPDVAAGWYAGAGGGVAYAREARADPETFDSGFGSYRVVSTTGESHAGAASAFVGYELARNFAVELGIRDYGWQDSRIEVDVSVARIGSNQSQLVRRRVRALTFDVVARIPLATRLSAWAAAGIASARLEMRKQTVFTPRFSEPQPEFIAHQRDQSTVARGALGIAYRFDDRWLFRAGYEYSGRIGSTYLLGRQPPIKFDSPVSAVLLSVAREF